MGAQSRLAHRTVTLVVVAMVLLGLLLVILDWGQVRDVLLRARWQFLPLALLFATLSLSCLAASYALLVRVFGIAISFRELFEVGLISNILNHLLPSGGSAGYSVGLVLARQRGLSLSSMVGASLLHGYLATLVLLVILPAGLIYLYLNYPLTPQMARTIVAVTVILMAVAVSLPVIIVHPILRRKVLGLLHAIGVRIFRREVGRSLVTFDRTMDRGVAAMRAAPLVAWGAVALSIADWAMAIVTLHYCFLALGPPPSPGVLITGFGIGISVGMASLVPGGLGVQEGSMAGIYGLLGIPLEQAALAAVLYRAIYYLVPFMLTLPLYGRFLRGSAVPQEPPGPKDE